MDREQVRQKITEANKTRQIINKSYKEFINKKLLFSLSIPLLLLTAYSALWLYEFGYFSYFAIPPNEIELNLFTGISASIILLVATIIITLLLSILVPVISMLLIIYIIAFFIFINILLIWQDMPFQLAIVLIIFFTIIFIIIASIVTVKINARKNKGIRLPKWSDDKLKNHKNLIVFIYLLVFIVMLSWMFWYFILNMHYKIYPSAVNASITALLLVFFLVITLVVLGISHIISPQYVDIDIQNKKNISWFMLPLLLPIILLFLLWGQNDAKDSYNTVSIKLVDMPNASASSYVLIRAYPDKLILKDITSTQIKTIRVDNASKSDNIKIEAVNQAIIEAPTIIIQGTENVVIKEEKN